MPSFECRGRVVWKGSSPLGRDRCGEARCDEGFPSRRRQLADPRHRVRRDAQRRWYELRPEPLAEVDAWLTSFRELWVGRFDRLDDYLHQLDDQDQQDLDEQDEEEGDHP